MTDLSLHAPEPVPFTDGDAARAHYREVGARLGREVRTPVIPRPARPVQFVAHADALPSATVLPVLIIGPMNIRAVRALAHWAAGELEGPLYIQGARGTGKSLLAAIAQHMCPDATVLDDAENKVLRLGEQLRPGKLVMTAAVPPAEMVNPTLRRACSEVALATLSGFDAIHGRAIALSMLGMHRRHFPGFTVPDPVLGGLVAASRDGHELATAMKGLLMHHWSGEPITGEVLQSVLAEQESARASRYPSIAVIQKVVARHFRVSVVDMQSQRRTAEVVLPRQVAMCLSKRLTLRSLPEIGRRFGGRDHTTVLHAVRKYDAIERAQPEVAALLASLTARIEQEAVGERA